MNEKVAERSARIAGGLLLLGCLLPVLQFANVRWWQERDVIVCRSRNGQALQLDFQPDFQALKSGCDYVVRTDGNPAPRSRGHYPRALCEAMLTDWSRQGACTRTK